MTEQDYARLELAAALAFWRAHHSLGARRRVREAIAYVRSTTPPPAPAAPALLEVPEAISWGYVASPLEKRRARVAGRTPTKAAPLLSFDNAQGSLF